MKRQKIVCGNRRPNILLIVWFLFCLGIFFFNNQQFYIFEITFIGDHQGLATDWSSANTHPRKQIKIRKYRQCQGVSMQCQPNEMKYFFLIFHDSIFIFAIKKFIQLSMQNMNNAFLIFKIMSIYSQFFLQQICCFALTSFWPAICILKSLVVSQ